MEAETANCGGHVSTPQTEVGSKENQISVNVDKIQVAIYFQHAIDEYERFPAYKWSVKNGDFAKKGKVHTPHPSSAFTAISQPLEEGGCLFIRYGYSHKMFKAFFEFNPNLVDMLELAGHLDLLLNDGYSSLHQRGIVTYCEFAADIPHAKFQDYVFLDSRLRSGCSGYSSVGSDYIGSRRSNRNFLAYDKRKQLVDCGKQGPKFDLLRIEARIRGSCRFLLSEIAAVASPFKTLIVVDRNAFAASADTSILKVREELLHHEGCLQLAYSSLSKQQRQLAVAALSAMQPIWWQPDVIWASFPHSQFVAAGSTQWLH